MYSPFKHWSFWRQMRASFFTHRKKRPWLRRGGGEGDNERKTWRMNFYYLRQGERFYLLLVSILSITLWYKYNKLIVIYKRKAIINIGIEYNQLWEYKKQPEIIFILKTTRIWRTFIFLINDLFISLKMGL